MLRILMVCVGNVCRSPVAERLMRQRAHERGWPVLVSSAGFEATEGAPMEPLAQAELVGMGGIPDGFRARRLTPQLVAGADLVLTATRETRTDAVQWAPSAMNHTFTLREFAALCSDAAATPGSTKARDTDSHLRGLISSAALRRPSVAADSLDVPDPMGRTAQVHAASALLISLAVDRILEAVTGP